MSKQSKKRWRILAGVLVVGLTLAAWAGSRLYHSLFAPIHLGAETTEVLIPTGATFEQVLDTLVEKQLVTDRQAFTWVAKLKKYTTQVKPGRYLIADETNQEALVDRLRSGRQDEVKLVLQEVRTLNDLAALLDRYLEPGEAEFKEALYNPETWNTYGLNEATMMTLFLPNTYSFYWNTSPEKTIQRLAAEHETFWNEERRNRLSQLRMTEEEVYTLASIVYAETKKADEANRVAGVYMNRLQQGIPLQADPTLIFAIGDFTIKRVLNKDREVDSPYNTYRYTGLPPGPINMPPLAWIVAVLNYEKHAYIFFCAKEDFSGYHNFAVTNAEHERNAARYRKALNQRKIFR